MGNGMKQMTFSNIYAVGQPSIAAAGHSLLAVSATIFWSQNQTQTIPSLLREIERTHSIPTLFENDVGRNKGNAHFFD